MSQPRIFSGKHRGRSLKVVEDKAVRPTAGRTRESVFNILMHGRFSGEDSPLIGKGVLDVFCGTGAYGLEALSRGAASATFVDQHTLVLKLAYENARKFGEEATTKFVQADASNLPKATHAYSLIFLDPPYDKGLAKPCLKSLAAQGWVDEESVIVLEIQAKETISLPEGYSVVDERIYGNAKVLILAWGEA